MPAFRPNFAFDVEMERLPSTNADAPGRSRVRIPGAVHGAEVGFFHPSIRSSWRRSHAGDRSGWFPEDTEQ